MAMYRCHSCDNFVDDDWHPMEASGDCPACHDDQSDDVPAAKPRPGEELMAIINDFFREKA
tara:strand:- start:243 stop:425 length:183 start_codon:yes stop_codon:yes gene_type:complete